MARARREAEGDTIVQECGAGLVRLRRDGDRLYFAAPPLLRHGPLPEADVGRIAAGLGFPVRKFWRTRGAQTDHTGAL